jgi:hypothetical protein
MTDWVQNIIIVQKQSKKNTILFEKQNLLLEKIINKDWMFELGFRTDDTFEVSETSRALKIYADTKFKPPLDVFEDWKRNGLIFKVYYCDVANYRFIGKWLSSGINLEVVVDTQIIQENLQVALDEIPEDLKRAFDFDIYLKNLI